MSEFYDRLRPVLEKISAEAMADIELRETIAALRVELDEEKKLTERYYEKRNALLAELARYKHLANEWADVATNAPQVLRNVRDGLSKFEDAIEYMSLQCRQVQKLSGERDATIAALQAEVARYKGYQYIEAQHDETGCIWSGPRYKKPGPRYTEISNESGEPPSGETSAHRCSCEESGIDAYCPVHGSEKRPSVAAASAQEQKK